jgi:hypothetical protein
MADPTRAAQFKRTKKNIQLQPHNVCFTHGPKSPNLTKLKILHLKSAPHAGPPAVNHAKSQTAIRPADPEEAPSKPMPKPTPEHLVGHPIIPTQKATACNSADSQCFSIFLCRFLF